MVLRDAFEGEVTTIADETCTNNTNLFPRMLRVKLREAMDDYRRRFGDRMTYEKLANVTGLSRATLESLASRESYNTRLSTIDKLCRALCCEPADLLELVKDEEGAGCEDRQEGRC